MKKLTSILFVVLLAFSSMSTLFVNAATPDVTNLTAVYNNTTSDFTVTGNSTSPTLVFQLYDNSNLVTPKMIKTITVTTDAFSATYPRGSLLPDGDYTASVKSVGAGAVAVTTQFHMGVTIDNQLQAAKDAATSAVTTYFGTYTQADYSDANWTALVAIKDTAIADIAATTVIADVAPLAIKAASDMDAVITASTPPASTPPASTPPAATTSTIPIPHTGANDNVLVIILVSIASLAVGTSVYFIKRNNTTSK